MLDACLFFVQLTATGGARQPEMAPEAARPAGGTAQDEPDCTTLKT